MWRWGVEKVFAHRRHSSILKLQSSSHSIEFGYDQISIELPPYVEEEFAIRYHVRAYVLEVVNGRFVANGALQ
jgi:hypothetical protein